MLNRSQVILVRTDSNLCRKELKVHWSAPNSLIRSYLQSCTNSMWGDESEAVAPIIWLYQTVDAQKEEVFFPDLLITLQRHAKKTSKLCITGLCEENSPVTSEFPAQRASNMENVSIWWRHHDNISWFLVLWEIRKLPLIHYWLLWLVVIHTTALVHPSGIAVSCWSRTQRIYAVVCTATNHSVQPAMCQVNYNNNVITALLDHYILHSHIFR